MDSNAVKDIMDHVIDKAVKTSPKAPIIVNFQYTINLNVNDKKKKKEGEKGEEDQETSTNYDSDTDVVKFCCF